MNFHKLPEPELQPLENVNDSWILTIKFGEIVQKHKKQLSVPEKFHCELALSYLEEAKRQAYEYCKRNDLGIIDDNSYMGQVKMLVIKNCN
jgi:hypothetical protein